jgi:membrane-associated protease RseP (regulator of RpoE activity)
VESEKDSPPPPEFDSPPRWERRRRFRLPEHPLFHLALLGATFLTTTVAGGLLTATGGIFGKGSLWDGLPFSVPVLVILGAHEMGHYIVCRRHGVAATLPYFIPNPLFTPGFIGFGTFGAVIRIKEPIRDRRTLIEIGAAGPITGFLTALPFLYYGVTHPEPVREATTSGATLFGYPIVVNFLQDLAGTGRYTSASVHEHPTFLAAWFGLLVTALNLIPIGQLDGGHVLRAAVARLQPYVSYGVLLLAALSLLASPLWAFFSAIVALVFGVVHPPLENEEEPLPFGHQLLALACLAVFLLCFSLRPIYRT